MIIYKHTCITSGKFYIGKTVKSIMARWWEEIFGIEGAAKRREGARIRKLNKTGV